MEGRPLPAVLWRQASAQLTKGPTDEREGEMGRLHLSALVICGALSLGGTDLVLGAEPPAIVFVSRDLPPASYWTICFVARLPCAVKRGRTPTAGPTSI